MSEFALNPSETRAARTAAPRNILRPLVLSAIGAGALAGFAVVASSVIGDLVAAPVRPGAMLAAAAPVIDGGLASKWPDLKDGLPAVAGAAPATKVVVSESAPRAEPVRMAALAPPTVGIPDVQAKAPAPPPVAARPVPPTQRIPTPTEVSVNPPPPAAKVIVPSRVAALLPPGQTVRAEDEAPVPTHHEAAVEKRPQSHPAAVATAAPAAEKPRKAAAKPAPEAHKVADAKANPPKAVAPKAVPAKVAAPKPSATTTTVAAATPAPDPEETDILGVKLPSLAPAGRKLREGVTALGDAVRSAF